MGGDKNTGKKFIFNTSSNLQLDVKWLYNSCHPTRVLKKVHFFCNDLAPLVFISSCKNFIRPPPAWPGLLPPRSSPAKILLHPSAKIIISWITGYVSFQSLVVFTYTKINNAVATCSSMYMYNVMYISK